MEEQQTKRIPSANQPKKRPKLVHAATLLPAAIGLACSSLGTGNAPNAAFSPSNTPVPLLAQGHPVSWWFAFKFNTATFPGCNGDDQKVCLFGGEVQQYPHGQQFVYASSDNPNLQKGSGCVGATVTDPLGATFDEVYNNRFHYVVWNDQFYDDPKIKGCTTSCGSPWGHSKGMLAWNDAGEGMVLQVTTPSWPAAGESDQPRKTDGNTLGCVDDNNVKVSQHFFAMQLTESDVVKVLKGLQNASVVTDTANPQIVNNGGPDEVQTLVQNLGVKSSGDTALALTLSNGIELISKPSALHVPPWQMVSSLLGGISLRTATWWATPNIPSAPAERPGCWSDDLANPGAVEIATSGQWDGTVFGLKGGPGPNFNHAKIGVSTAPGSDYVIFGDMNQQGSLSGPNCGSSQNGRGGLFYVLSNEELAGSVRDLLKGDSALASSGFETGGDF
ncbi:MAG: hypothetical protein OSA97_01050 [Nevskia sp.]|nr:hypothetical protein [Nevskia sp.]